MNDTMIPSDNGDGDEATTRWEGFSDYQTVSNSIVRSVDEALDAFTILQSLHTEGAKVKPRQAARGRAKILSAALRLVPELRDDAPDNEQYREILARWLGDVEIDDETYTADFSEYDGEFNGGFIDELDTVQLHTVSPGWLYQFVVDIRTAAWHLGYLQAGRTISESNLEPADEQARDMFTQ